MNKKRWILAGLLMMLAAAAAGCGTKEPAPQSGSQQEVTDTAEEQQNNGQSSKMQEFQLLLMTGAQEKQAFAKLLEIAPELSQEEASQMVLALEDYQTKAIKQGTVVGQELMDLMPGQAYDEKAINDLSAIKNDQLKAAVQSITDRGYKIIVPEGNYQGVINYRVYKPFASYVTPDLKAYLEIMAAESDQRTLEDAGIIIPIEEVFRRARACETFLEQYPTSQKAEQVKTMYGSYLDSLFLGQNNTPAFDYDTKQLNETFRSSYEKAALDSTNSALTKATAAYEQVLQENEFQLTDKVDSYRKSMIEKLKK